MRLTDSTEIRSICGGSRVAIFAGTAPAVILPANHNDVFVCGWAYEIATEDGPGVAECQAVAVGFDNGFLGECGHSHFTDAEYFEAEEVLANARQGFLPPANARYMDNGGLVY